MFFWLKLQFRDELMPIDLRIPLVRYNQALCFTLDEGKRPKSFVEESNTRVLAKIMCICLNHLHSVRYREVFVLIER